MFIEIEKTPDPATLKFFPGRTVLDSGAADFADRDAAERSPLAGRLFEVEGVTAVSLGADFVTVTKADDGDWQLLKPALLGVLMEHFLEDRPVLLARPHDLAPDYDAEDADTVEEIRELLDRRIRPGLAEEGGDVILRSYRNGAAELEFLGTALSSPAFSLKVRIENTLRHYIPEIAEVRFVQPGLDAGDEKLDRSDPEAVAVHSLLEEQVNPGVAAHGGHISLIDIKDHTAYIRLEGGCQGCGMADVTLKLGVERMIKEAVPTITDVLDVTDHGGGTNPYYQPEKGGVSPF